ncbi:hypothetical protein [Natrinema thermotolerans]|uniref:hypothetical protein n=1 Tax=Natrinema thermotolerans TaxID=121872 RepID=UPI0009FD5DAD|nr:hypothetical protein [Natrinema thermotolerans]QCC57194.1 hypothetical protein DVR14_00530 [Natrinema thermotolerans]
MATNSRSRQSTERDPRASEGTASYSMVDRRLSSTTGLESESIETLRDMLNLESRLRVTAPGAWRPEKRTPRERSWSGYGSVVRLRKQGRLGPWTVLEDGDVLLSDADRREAFETAAERMRAIAQCD